jgi:hypothetical protein
MHSLGLFGGFSAGLEVGNKQCFLCRKHQVCAFKTILDLNQIADVFLTLLVFSKLHRSWVSILSRVELDTCDRHLRMSLSLSRPEEFAVMPRHRKSSTGELKTKRIPVCVTESEYEYIRERSGALSMSEYLLRAGLNETIPQRRSRRLTPELNRLTYLELGNINQALQHITDWCQQNRRLSEADGFPNLDRLQRLHDQLDALQLAIAGVNAETLKEEDWLT